MKKTLFIATFLIGLALPLLASAQVSNPYWRQGAGIYITPTSPAFGLQVPGIATSSTGCLSINSTGWISANGSSCSGGGGSSTFGTTSISALPPLSWNTSTAVMSFLWGWLFPNNATSTNLDFTGGLTSAGVFVNGISSNALTNGAGIDYENPNLYFNLPSTEGYYWYNQGRGVNLLMSMVGSGVLRVPELATPAGTFLAADASGNIIATSTPGGSSSSFGYPFPNNATTTGLGIYATSTLGNGTQAGGLTISGGATTTGNLLVNGTGTFGSTFSSSVVLGQTNYGVYVANADSEGVYSAVSGTGATSYGVTGQATGAATTNYGLYGSATGGTTNYGLYVANGRSAMGQASTTMLTNTGLTYLTGLSTGTGNGALCATSGGLIEYSSGANCVAGNAGTVTSIATTYPVTGGTFTTSGTIALAFGTTTANSWSMLQNFTNASSSQITAGVSNQFYINSTGEITGYDKNTGAQGQISPSRYIAFALATSTAWTGTSTYGGVYYGDTARIYAPFTGSTETLMCGTDSGTLTIEGSDGSTHIYMAGASTTANTNVFSLSFTKGDLLTFVGGNPATSPTTTPCTLGAVQTP